MVTQGEVSTPAVPINTAAAQPSLHTHTAAAAAISARAAKARRHVGRSQKVACDRGQLRRVLATHAAKEDMETNVVRCDDWNVGWERDFDRCTHELVERSMVRHAPVCRCLHTLLASSQQDLYLIQASVRPFFSAVCVVLGASRHFGHCTYEFGGMTQARLPMPALSMSFRVMIVTQHVTEGHDCQSPSAKKPAFECFMSASL